MLARFNVIGGFRSEKKKGSTDVCGDGGAAGGVGGGYFIYTIKLNRG